MGYFDFLFNLNSNKLEIEKLNDPLIDYNLFENDKKSNLLLTINKKIIIEINGNLKDNIFSIKSKSIKNLKGERHSFNFGYSYATYNHKGKLYLLNRHWKGRLDSLKTGGPAIEYYHSCKFKCKWYNNGKDLTDKVKLFREQHNISEFPNKREKKFIMFNINSFCI